MKSKKNLWYLAFATMGLEAATLVSWFKHADPKVTKGLLVASLALELYVVPKVGYLIYKTYKENSNFTDYCSNLGIPFFSNMWQKNYDDKQCQNSQATEQTPSPAR